MADDHILGLVPKLVRSLQTRCDAARELGEYLGALDLLILIPEKDHSLWLPAYGFPQTLYGGRKWRAFVAEINANEFAVAGELSYPALEQKRMARGWTATDRSILVLFDGEPRQDRVDRVRCLLPIIRPIFEKERTALISSAQLKLAQQGAQQARALAESLDSVRAQLQATVILREQDLARRMHAEAELERSNVDLKRLNEDLTQFTYAASHDVREPLRMIAIYVQLLQKQLAGQLDNKAEEYITHVVDGAQRIARLIDGLLEFSRVGQIQTEAEAPVQSEAALQEALKDLRMVLVEHNAEVSYSELPLVLANRVHLSQLFQNLIANAIKYRRPGHTPEIRISARRKGEDWIFAVKDNGIGIAPEHIDMIFLPFKRLHGSEIAGAGIGLATCKRIVEGHGGRLWVESEPGEGSTFYFSLPLRFESNEQDRSVE